MMTRTLDTIRDEAVVALRSAVHGPDAGRSDRLRAVADLLVEARERFYTSDGTVDWTGRTHAYRRFSSEVYSGAGIPPGETHTLQAAVRYHVSNALRDRLDPETLEALGLRTESARDRSTEKRARQSEILASLSGGPLETPERVLQALQVAESVLRRVPDAVIASAPLEDRRRLRAAADAVAGEASRLARVTKVTK